MTSPEIEDEQVQREMNALGTVYGALRSLEPQAQRSILEWVIDRLGLAGLGATISEPARRTEVQPDMLSTGRGEVGSSLGVGVDAPPRMHSEEVEGISPVAQKWMARSGLSPDKLVSIFSLNLDEIDLISPAVPGDSVKQRMRSVMLLKALASYLATGAARVKHEQVKEAGLHYKAYDQNNFAWYLKDFGREITGAKESGYQLTPAGMAAATALVQEMIGNPQSPAIPSRQPVRRKTKRAEPAKKRAEPAKRRKGGS